MIANDLSASAVDAIKRNVDLNGLGAPPAEAPLPPSADADGDGEGNAGVEAGVQDAPKRKPAAPKAKVQINEGDAWYVNELRS